MTVPCFVYAKVQKNRGERNDVNMKIWKLDFELDEYDNLMPMKGFTFTNQI